MVLCVATQFAPLLLHHPVLHCRNLGWVRGCEKALFKCSDSLCRNIRNGQSRNYFSQIKILEVGPNEWKPREFVVAVTVVIITVTVKSGYSDTSYCDKGRYYCH